MGKKSDTIRYETVVQLLLLAAVILMPFLASNFMDCLELFSVSKTMISSFWSAIKPWLSPSYVCLFINFIIFFIAASSSMSSNSSSPTDSFVESSTLSHNLAPYDHDHDRDHENSTCPPAFHTLEDTKTLEDTCPPTFDHTPCPPTFDHTLEDTCKDRYGGEGRLKEAVPESVVDMRELRKSKTFNGGELRSTCRKERYVRVLSQEELDRRVEAFIGTFKKKKKESNGGLKLRSIYEQDLV